MLSWDLRDFISDLSKLQELKTLDGASCEIEIGTITEIMAERRGPALLFDNIVGYEPGRRILTNLTSTPRRMAVALGLETNLPPLEVARGLKDRLKTFGGIKPVEVNGGPIKDNILRGDEAQTNLFPAPKWHEDDGGPYIGTGCAVVMKDPDEGWINVGTYRAQVHSPRRLGLYISAGHHGRLISEAYWARGEDCPVAIVLGLHPVMLFGSFIAAGWGVSEYETAGGLAGKPVELVKGEITGLPVPASSEIVIEGFLPPRTKESHPEGPFGEWTGYYATGARDEPVVRVEGIMYRDDPIITGAAPLKPPASPEGEYIYRAASVWHELDKAGVPGINGVWKLPAGGGRYLTVISLRQRYPGHARQAALASMSGSDGAYHGRFVIMVDDDIDPTNENDVLWAIATRCDPKASIDVIRRCWSTPLDPTIPPWEREKRNFTNSRAIIDACRPFEWIAEFPPVNKASDQIRKKIIEKWTAIFSESSPVVEMGKN